MYTMLTNSLYIEGRLRINKNSKYCSHVNCLLLIAFLAIMSTHPNSVADTVI